jgi:site-specific DNA recombinase
MTCSPVKEIVLTSEDDELKIDVRGGLAGILEVCLKTKTPAAGAGELQGMIVVRASNHQKLPAQSRDLIRTTDLRSLVSQFFADRTLGGRPSGLFRSAA